MIRLLFKGLLLLQIITVGAQASCNEEIAAQNTIKIGVLGDSVFTSNPKGCGSLTHILRKTYQTKFVVNSAVGGATVLGFGSSAVRNQKLPWVPDILIVGGGGNDFGKCGPNMTCLRSKINDLISKSLKSGGLHRAIQNNSNENTRVVIAYTSIVASHAPEKWQYMVSSGLGEMYAQRSREYAEAYPNVEYFNLATVLDPNNTKHWLKDGFHPSSLGYELMAKALAQ